MIACVDLSRSGKLELEEFKELWQLIRLWKAIFKKTDSDHTGSINCFQLKRALREVGKHYSKGHKGGVWLKHMCAVLFSVWLFVRVSEICFK